MAFPYINMNQPQIYTCNDPIPKPLPPPSSPYPSALSQSTGFDCPAAWIDFSLVIEFAVLHMVLHMVLYMAAADLGHPACGI